MIMPLGGGPGCSLSGRRLGCTILELRSEVSCVMKSIPEGEHRRHQGPVAGQHGRGMLSWGAEEHREVGSRDVTLLTKACLVKAVVFPVVMYRCESWTIKKAED